MDARFEAAADAIVCGDIRALERLLREDPELYWGRRFGRLSTGTLRSITSRYSKAYSPPARRFKMAGWSGWNKRVGGLRLRDLAWRSCFAGTERRGAMGGRQVIGEVWRKGTETAPLLSRLGLCGSGLRAMTGSKNHRPWNLGRPSAGWQAEAPAPP
jgi:hypothetical protein